MPSQATNYFYTLVAMGVIALMVTNSFEQQAAGLKLIGERRELEELLETVASECTELVSLTEATGASAEICLHAPQMIGERRYWIKLASDSTGAWIEGAFGEPWTGNPDYRVYLPWNVSASGTYKGGYGTLSINCSDQGSGPELTLGRYEVG